MNGEVGNRGRFLRRSLGVFTLMAAGMHPMVVILCEVAITLLLMRETVIRIYAGRLELIVLPSQESDMTRVLIVSSRPLIRQLIRVGLKSLNAQSEPVEELSSDQETMAHCIAFAPNLVIFDLTEPRTTDFLVLRELGSASAVWALLIIASQIHYVIVQAIVHNRGFGVISLESPIQTLVHAAWLVASGGTYIDAAFRPLLDQCMRKCGANGLSRRERHVLQLIAQGYSTKEVADILKLGVKTVDKYRSSVMKKLHVHDVVRLTHCAIRLGLLSV